MFASSLRLIALLTALPAISLSAERIVSLGGAVTETIYALGAGDEIVARDTSSVFPSAALELPDIGYFRSIGAEGVLSQRPTLILAATGTGPDNQVEKLRGSGVRFLYLEATPSAESALGLIDTLGRELGRQDAAAKLTAELRAKLDTARGRAASAGSHPSVVFLLGMSGTATQGAYEDTAADALIKLAGGRNALTGMHGYKSLTPEALFVLDPDVILYGTNPTNALHTKPPEWIQSTRAAREGRLHALDLGYHLVFGPRLGEAVSDVSALLHPDYAATSSEAPSGHR